MNREVKRVAFIALLMGVLGGILGAFLAGGTASAHYNGTEGTNPWVLTETNANAEGLRINAAEGANGQPFVVYDYLNQPIAAINRAGGFGVFGDMISGFDGPDIFNYQVRIDPVNSAPPSGECLGLSGKYDRLWIGGRGSTAGMYQCKVGGYGFYWSKIA